MHSASLPDTSLPSLSGGSKESGSKFTDCAEIYFSLTAWRSHLRSQLTRKRLALAVCERTCVGETVEDLFTAPWVNFEANSGNLEYCTRQGVTFGSYQRSIEMQSFRRWTVSHPDVQSMKCCRSSKNKAADRGGLMVLFGILHAERAQEKNRERETETITTKG